MIIILDLSNIRKVTQHRIDDLIFSLKMSNKDFRSYKEQGQKALMCLIFSGQIAANTNTEFGQRAVNFEKACKYVELYSIPVLYSVYEVLKAKDSFIQSVSEVTRNSKKLLIRKKK
ncbi:hypothetical protein [Clostridium thermarum]|uniref:hypothetical protein n=1 Tax=Clostridium thermarum TaxID=1716543 RepID=UPI00112345FB|nr:hypothetical protein [Clostridium thermarum]